jgi:23S rRNA (cytosine1962-C5)-methyltransferase
MMTKLYLHKGKEQSLLRKHPWVFSGAIRKTEGEAAEGDLVSVHTARGEFLGLGHYQPSSIAVRLISFEEVEVAKPFWIKKIKDAFTLRQRLGLVDSVETNTYRLIYAEGDGLPSLIVDVYGDTAVLQAHSIGMWQSRFDIAEALKEVMGERLKAVYDKSAESLPAKTTTKAENGYILGDGPGKGEVLENGNRFSIDWAGGQKTGFFIDQRANRALLGDYVAGKKVLNTFCYTGGFSVYALNAGASLVHSVDVSKKAIALTDENIQLNKQAERHASFAVDTFDFFRDQEEMYDVVVLDPPAFAKRMNVRHNALMGYKRLNAEAIRRIAPGGILFTFSCSQVVDKYLFNNTIMAAAIEAGREVKVLHQLNQPADHPFSIFHPEGEYLKGLVLYVA